MGPASRGNKKQASMNGQDRRSDRDPVLPRYERYGNGSPAPV